MKFFTKLVILVLVKIVASQDDYEYPEQDNVCEGVDDDVLVGFGADVSCTGYYYCYGGVGEPEECPEGQQFNYDTNECDEEENVQCQDPNGGDYPEYGEETDYPEYGEETDYPQYGEETDPPTRAPPGTIPTRAPVETTTTSAATSVSTSNPNDIEDITCPTNQPGQIIFFPSSNCTEYFICANGNKLRMTCLEGFAWNQELTQCDFPMFSKCAVSFGGFIRRNRESW